MKLRVKRQIYLGTALRQLLVPRNGDHSGGQLGVDSSGLLSRAGAEVRSTLNPEILGSHAVGLYHAHLEGRGVRDGMAGGGGCPHRGTAVGYVQEKASELGLHWESPLLSSHHIRGHWQLSVSLRGHGKLGMVPSFVTNPLCTLPPLPLWDLRVFHL